MINTRLGISCKNNYNFFFFQNNGLNYNCSIWIVTYNSWFVKIKTLTLTLRYIYISESVHTVGVLDWVHLPVPQKRGAQLFDSQGLGRKGFTLIFRPSSKVGLPTFAYSRELINAHNTCGLLEKPSDSFGDHTFILETRADRNHLEGESKSGIVVYT